MWPPVPWYCLGLPTCPAALAEDAWESLALRLEPPKNLGQSWGRLQLRLKPTRKAPDTELLLRNELNLNLP